MSRSERPLEGRQAGIVAVQASRLQNSHQHQRLRALSVYTFSMELKKSASASSRWADMSAMDRSTSWKLPMGIFYIQGGPLISEPLRVRYRDPTSRGTQLLRVQFELVNIV